MRSLAEAEADVAMEVPLASGVAIKACVAGTASTLQAQEAVRFIVYELCGVDKLRFALPGEGGLAAWWAGRRFVGLQIKRIVATPTEEEAAALLPERAVEALRRRRPGR
jgi:hypothetical protein